MVIKEKLRDHQSSASEGGMDVFQAFAAICLVSLFFLGGVVLQEGSSSGNHESIYSIQGWATVMDIHKYRYAVFNVKYWFTC